jgi:hypothetical protein
MAANNPMAKFSQIPMSKLIPGLIVGLIAVAAAGAIVGDWAMNIMDLSFRTTGRYAKNLEVPAPPIQLPKDSYLCPANTKNPWIGCTIR